MIVSKNIGLYPHKCKQCGKEFECRSEWAYKLPRKGRLDHFWFCTHRCIRAYEEALQEKKMRTPSERDREILELLAEGVGATEIARKMGLSYYQVVRIRDKWADLKRKNRMRMEERNAG